MSTPTYYLIVVYSLASTGVGTVVGTLVGIVLEVLTWQAKTKKTEKALVDF